MCYLALNCKEPPFNNRKVRQAFSLALDRGILARFYSAKATPTYSIYSPVFSQDKSVGKENKLVALKMLIEGLEEEGIDLRSIQKKSIYVASANESLVCLLVEQLNDALYLKWKPCVIDPTSLLTLSMAGRFTAKLYWWFNRVADPSYFLDAFSSKRSTGDSTFWIDHRLQAIIEKLQQQECLAKRKALHKQAEHLLNWEKPLIPLFYVPTHSFISNDLIDVYFSSSAHFDLRCSYKMQA